MTTPDDTINMIATRNGVTRSEVLRRAVGIDMPDRVTKCRSEWSQFEGLFGEFGGGILNETPFETALALVASDLARERDARWEDNHLSAAGLARGQQVKWDGDIWTIAGYGARGLRLSRPLVDDACGVPVDQVVPQ